MTNRQLKYCTLLTLALLAAMSDAYCQQDTVKRRLLQAVEITGEQIPSETYTATPVELLTQEKLEQKGAVQLSDAVKGLTGVVLKDYGGVGGVKTMSARGLGSQMSGLLIDGVAVSDCQNGQIDLGRYEVGNSAWVGFANGQLDDLLQSAKAMATGNVLRMETQEPTFKGNEWWNLKVGYEAGSWNLHNPTAKWEHKVNNRLSYTVWGSWLSSQGNYTFKMANADSIVTRTRENSAMWMATGDGNLIWKIDSRNTLKAKVHYMESRHELPGPVIFYTIKNSERSAERLLFGQVKYTYFGRKLRVQALGKYQITQDKYEDTAASNVTGYLRNLYTQQEGYGSGTLVWNIIGGLKMSLAKDLSYNTLSSNLQRNNEVRRLTSLSALALGYDNEWLSASANCLVTLAAERANGNPNDAAKRNYYGKISPYVGFNVKPFRRLGLRLRYFYKDHYRVPNFNELYYFSITRDLKPEKAMQHNVGLTWVENWIAPKTHIRLQVVADCYYNKVSDKLIAVPMQNMFLWSMMNLGRVDIHGVDHKVDFMMDFHNKVKVDLSLNYAFQHAVDLTDETTKYYKHQIPYTPRNSGGASLNIETKWVDIGYTAMVVGERYYRQQNAAEYRLEPYCDQSLSLSHTFVLRNDSKLKVRAQVLNLFNVQYEVVRSYPMMGRNYRLGISYEL